MNPDSCFFFLFSSKVFKDGTGLTMQLIDESLSASLVQREINFQNVPTETLFLIIIIL